MSTKTTQNDSGNDVQKAKQVVEQLETDYQEANRFHIDTYGKRKEREYQYESHNEYIHVKSMDVNSNHFTMLTKVRAKGYEVSNVDLENGVFYFKPE